MSWDPDAREPAPMSGSQGPPMLPDRLVTRDRLTSLIEQVRAEVSPGTSALFVMSSDAVMDKVREAFSDLRPELIFTNLSDDQEAAIREVFAE